jgi:hypothetical protein
VIAVGTRIRPYEPDYCRRCETIRPHSYFVASHEAYDCTCGDEHEGEAWGWSCVHCGFESDGVSKMLTKLAQARMEPEAQ